MKLPRGWTTGSWFIVRLRGGEWSRPFQIARVTRATVWFRLPEVDGTLGTPSRSMPIGEFIGRAYRRHVRRVTETDWSVIDEDVR